MVSRRTKQILFVAVFTVYCSSVFVVITELHKVQLPVTEIADSIATEEDPSWVENVSSHCFEKEINISNICPV